MVYGRYKNSRNAAWQCLIDYKISSLPVNVVKIASAAGIKVIKNSTVPMLRSDEIGLSIAIDNQWFIIYDDTTSRQNSRFTIAHELGHIFLGHDLQGGVSFRRSGLNKPKPAKESEADIFASRLLAPACVLWGLEISCAEQISHLCDISLQRAQIRYKRFEKLQQRNKFLTSPLEQQVYKNFEKYIQSNKIS